MKTTPITFPLASSANRIALLVGVLEGTVPAAQIKAEVEHDSLARPYRKPVVAEGIRFDSVTDAAKALTMSDDHRVVESRRQQIARWCNADNVDGYYWSL